MKLPFTSAARSKPDEAQQRIDWETSDPPRALLEYAGIGDVQKVQDLLASGVDPNAEVMINLTVDTVMYTPLLVAAGGGHVAVADMLIAAGAHVDKHDEDDYTPLIRAAADGKADMVAFLRSKGADINAREDIFNHTALHKAVRLGHPETVEKLIALGTDMTLMDKGGQTAEETICDQFGGSPDDRAGKTATIQRIFDTEHNRIEALQTAEMQKRAEAFANAAVLQNDLTLQAPPQTIRRRTPKGPAA